MDVALPLTTYKHALNGVLETATPKSQAFAYVGHSYACICSNKFHYVRDLLKVDHFSNASCVAGLIRFARENYLFYKKHHENYYNK